MREPQSEEIHKTSTLPFDSKYLYSLFYVLLLFIIVKYVRNRELVWAVVCCRELPKRERRADEELRSAGTKMVPVSRSVSEAASTSSVV